MISQNYSGAKGSTIIPQYALPDGYQFTGAKTYGHWSMDYWDEYEVPTFNGYTPSQSVVEENL